MNTCSLCSPTLQPILWESDYWRLVLNHNQNLLGKCFLMLKRHLELVPDLALPEWNDLHHQMRQATQILRDTFQPDHFNYAFLQNQDRHIHLHIIPRYANPRTIADISFTDPDYPHHYAVPSQPRLLSNDQLKVIADFIKGQS